MQSKADRVYQVLLARIRKGEYHFGRRFSAAVLARELGVSRQPVMAAVALLEAEGFMSVQPQVSCSIVKPTEPDVVDFFELFAVLEGLLARLAVERASPGDLPRLEAAERKLRATQVRGLLPLSYGTYARRFHAVIHNMARTPKLKQRVESVWGLADFYINTAHVEIAQTDIQQEHDERRFLVEAIGRQDNGIEEAMRAHIRRKLYRIGPGKNWSSLRGNSADGGHL